MPLTAFRMSLALFLGVVQALSVSSGQDMAGGKGGRGTIAFLSDRDGELALYVMQADGSDQRRLAGPDSGGICLAPAWSPDGRTLAYLVVPNASRSNRHGPVELWAVAAGGGVPVRLGAGNADTLVAYPWTIPTWSPDGTRLAFVAAREVSGTRRSVVTILQGNGGGVERAIPLDWLASAVTWSPDGRRLLIEDMSQDETVRTHNAHVVAVDGQGLQEVARTILSAAWSPDGTDIVTASATGEVLIIKPDGTTRRLGPQPGSRPVGVAWSPDGTTIAVVASSSGDGWPTHLYTISVATGRVTRVFDNRNVLRARFSPDGQDLVISTLEEGRQRPRPYGTIWTYRIATGSLTPLTTGKAYNAEGSWAFRR